MMQRVFAAVAAMAVLAGVCSAVEPSTRPASRPATQSADPTTPKGAVQAFLDAMSQGDPERVAGCLEATTDGTKKLAVALRDYTAGIAKVKKAAAGKLGDAAAAALRFDTPVSAEELLSGEADIQGDRAVIRAQSPTHLRKAGPTWKIDLDSTLKANDDDPAELATGIDEDAKDLANITAGIESGKYKTVEQIQEVLNEGPEK